MKQLSTLLVMITLMVMQANAQTFTLKSNDLGGQFANKQYFNGMGYTGDNQSPALSWENAPAGTKAFAVTMYDFDAPTGSGFWHWVVYNIPADVKELKAGAGNPAKNLLPAGAVQGLTDYGQPGYGGPAPVPGLPHTYLITVYALKTTLQLDKGATPAFVGFNLNMNILAKASMVAYAVHP